MTGLYSRVVYMLWFKRNEDNELAYQQKVGVDGKFSCCEKAEAYNPTKFAGQIDRFVPRQYIGLKKKQLSLIT